MLIVDKQDQELLDALQVARRLGVSRPYIYKLMDQRKIPFVQVGTVRRVRAEDLQAFIEQNTHRAK